MTTTSASQGYRTINPATGELLKSFDNATDQQIADALDASQAAYEQWSRKSVAERAAVVKRISELLAERSKDIAALITTEMGKSLGAAVGEVRYGAQIFGYYADEAEELLADQPIKQFSGQEAFVQRLPLGPLLGIMPWNFPVYQVARFVAPNLVLGNTILLKHAEINPQVAQLLEELFTEAGLPEGVYQNVFATHDQISTIIADPRVQGVALTGSEGAGAVVAAQAGNALKKSTMELGGADAFVVLADADLDKTVQWAVTGRHWNAGQVCCSSKRIIVVDEVYDAFLEKYKAGVAKLKAGDPLDPSTTLAPLSSQGAVDDLKKQVEQAVAHGATAEVIGAEVPATGSFFQPVLLSNVSDDNPAHYWEFFGPVSQVIRAKDEAEAIAIANDSPFGLGGSVFTQDIKHGVEVAQKISTGMVYINHPTGVAADLPFGGVRRSGYGRELVGLGIKEFVNHKLIAVTDIDGAF